jgi:hypothetical protein
MALPQLPDTFKGKTFGQISKDIEAKYKDRFDPISKRGLMAEMGALKEQQEYQKAKTEARQMLEQQMQQAQQINPMQDSMEQPMDASMVNPMEQQMGTPIESSNQGISPEMLPQDNTNFQHAASQSYNQQFAYGGNMDFQDQIQYANGDWLNRPKIMSNLFMQQSTEQNPILYNTNTNTKVNAKNKINASAKAIPQTNTYDNIDYFADINYEDKLNKSYNNLLNGKSFDQIIDARLKGIDAPIKEKADVYTKPINPQGIDPMRFAPLAANLYGILSARKAPSTQAQLNKMGFRDRVDESLATRIAPRQTQFSNVDMSQIERGITDQARGFTGSNVNMSGGQSGNFMANELANQSNVMNAIANARAQAQMQNQQVRGMNAQEQARVDAMMQQQAMQRAGLQGQNIGLGMQMADFDARNLGAFNANRQAGIQALGQNIGNVGKESDMMKMIANMTGYNSFGDYIQSLPPEERPSATRALMQSLGNIFKARG